MISILIKINCHSQFIQNYAALLVDVCACMSVFVVIVLGPVQGEAFDHLSVVATKPGSAVFLEVSGGKWACRCSSSSACLHVKMCLCSFAIELNHFYSFSLCFGAIMTGVFMACLSADTQKKGVEFELDPAVWKTQFSGLDGKLKAWEASLVIQL